MTDSPVHAPLVIDVAGTTLTPADRRRLADRHVGGVIHFARNWASRAQLSALNAEIKALRPDILICVDHEGGRVQRFRTDGFTRLPPMRALGALWMQDGHAGAGAVQGEGAAGVAGRWDGEALQPEVARHADGHRHAAALEAATRQLLHIDSAASAKLRQLRAMIGNRMPADCQPGATKVGGHSFRSRHGS